MSLKTEYNSFNEDDFVENGGEMKELTVTITLCEYRYLIAEQTRNEAEIDRLQDQLKRAEERAKLMADVVMLDHPEFFGDVIGAVTKFLKKMTEPISCEEADCDERTEAM